MAKSREYPFRVPSHPCIAVIADVVQSRRYEDGERAALQTRLQKLLEGVNRRYRPTILSRFVITTGDEFQGLLSSASAIPDLLWDMEQLPPTAFRIGIGHGRLSTPLSPEAAVGMDGPVWYNARDAITLAKKGRRLGGVFIGFDAYDMPLNGFARLLHHFRDRLIPSQRVTFSRLREVGRQAALVGSVAPTKQAVGERVKLLRWEAYREGEAGFRALLKPYDYAAAWKRH
jgi:hypothetical protein